MIKLVATDIDGTILGADNVFRPKILETIEKLKKKNIKMVLATGRIFEGVWPVRNMLGLDTPVICTQGSLAKDENNTFWSAPVDNSLVWDVVEFLKKKNIHTNLYNNDKLFIEDTRYIDDYIRGRFVKYNLIKSFYDLKLGEVTKMLAIVYDEDEIRKLEAEMKERYAGKLGIVLSSKCYLEITNPIASKGNALKKLMEIWNLKEDEVFASGDQDNDIELLKVAGVKVAMQNASNGLKNVANYIAPPVYEDGWAEAIERFVLCE